MYCVILTLDANTNEYEYCISTLGDLLTVHWFIYNSSIHTNMIIKEYAFSPLDDSICVFHSVALNFPRTLEHQREEKICIQARMCQWARREGGASGWSRGRSAVYALVTAAVQWITHAEIWLNPSVSYDQKFTTIWRPPLHVRPIERHCCALTDLVRGLFWCRIIWNIVSHIFFGLHKRRHGHS